MTRVRGYCPMGCGQTLVLGPSGYIRCNFLPCPRPEAVSAILRDDEHEHIVDLTEDGFTIRHPLQERLEDALQTCQVDRILARISRPPTAVGRYRVRLLNGDNASWTWTALDTPAEASHAAE